MRKNIATVEGVKTRFLCNIAAPEGVNTEMSGYVKVGGISLPMLPGGTGELVAPGTPCGEYLYELRCGGAVVAWGNLCARPSAFPVTPDATAVKVEASVAGEVAVDVNIHLMDAPPGEKGERGEQGEKGEPLTYADLTEEQKAELAEPARKALEAHTGDAVVHVTEEERGAWNGKAASADLSAHTGDAVVHVTSEERTAWDAKLGAEALMTEEENGVDVVAGAEKNFNLGNYAVLAGAFVPGGTLKRLVVSIDTPGVLWLEQRESADAAWRVVGQTSETLEEKETLPDMGELPVWVFDACELTAGQDLRISILNEEGEYQACFIGCSGKSDGSCVYDLNTQAEVTGRTVVARFYVPHKVEKYAAAADFDAHTGDTTVHVTDEERAAWDGKAASADLSEHTSDAVVHVTAAEREAWNGKAASADLSAHTGDTTVHVTDEERAAWNAAAAEGGGGSKLYRFSFVVQEDFTAKLAIPAEAPSGRYLLPDVYSFIVPAWWSKITSWGSHYIFPYTDKDPFYSVWDLPGSVNNGEKLARVGSCPIEHTAGNETIIAQAASEVELEDVGKFFYWGDTYYKPGEAVDFVYATYTSEMVEF